MEIKELQNLYFCNWEHKFWGPASPLAPNALLTLNHFTNAASVIDPELQEYFEIYWFEQGITGEVKLPGHWNYCYLNGKYYHLEKTKSDGYFENKGELVEFFFYTVLYDEWANEILTNQIHVRGTLAKTGDYIQASKYIHTITPIIINGNDVVYIDAKEQEKTKSENTAGREFYKRHLKTMADGYLRICQPYTALRELIQYDRDKSPEHYPFITYYSFETTLIYQLLKFIAREDLFVFDVDRTKINPETFNTRFNHHGQFYAIAASEDVSYILSTSINKSKRIKVEELTIDRRDHSTDRERQQIRDWKIRVLDPATYKERDKNDFTRVKKGKAFLTPNARDKDPGWLWTYKRNTDYPIYKTYHQLFRRFIDMGLLHSLEQDRVAKLEPTTDRGPLGGSNESPRRWRVGNRVWTTEELDQTKWFKVCKPYERIGVDKDGKPLYFLGFDPDIFPNDEATFGGKTLAEWLEFIKKQNPIKIEHIPNQPDDKPRLLEFYGVTHKFINPVIDIGNPGYWYGFNVDHVIFAYDHHNRDKSFWGVELDWSKWKIWLTTRVLTKEVERVDWGERLSTSINEKKEFGLHNTRFGYGLSKTGGHNPGTVKYFVPVYEDSDENLLEDWVFAASAVIVGCADTTRDCYKPKLKVKDITGGDTVPTEDGNSVYGLMEVDWGGQKALYGKSNSFNEQNQSELILLINRDRTTGTIRIEDRPGVKGYIAEGLFTRPIEDWINTRERSWLKWWDTHRNIPKVGKRLFEWEEEGDERNLLQRLNPFNIDSLATWINWDKPVFKSIKPDEGEGDGMGGTYYHSMDAIYEEIEEQIRLKPILLDLDLFVAYCIIKNGKWHFELLVKDNDRILEDVKCIRHVFIPKDELKRPENQLPSEEDVIQAINSSNVISVYGQEIPVRDRFILDGKEIDWNLHISALNDKYQAASNYFLVEAQSPESLVRITLDIPKEGVFAIQTISPIDKRDTLMSFVNNETNRFYERSNLEMEKRQFHINFERESKYIPAKRTAEWGSWVSGLFGMIGGAISAAAGVVLMGSGVGAGLGVGLLTTGLGIMGGAIGARSQRDSMQTRHSEEDEERADRLRHSMENFKLRGEQMQVHHQEAERQEMVHIRNMANSNTYGNTTHAINYQGFNEHFGTSDIHLTHYRPAGDVLERLKWYYQEYGFDLMVPDQYCFGISSIKGHIRFSQIQENRGSDNPTIRALIEGRLLAGVRVVDLEGKPLGPHEYPLKVLYETCVTRYDELQEQQQQLIRERAELQKERDKLNQDIEAHKGTIDQKDKTIAEKDKELSDKTSELEAKNKAIAEKDSEIAKKAGEIAKALEDIKNLEKAKEAETQAKIKAQEDLDKANTQLEAKQGELTQFESDLTKALQLQPQEDRNKIIQEAKFQNGQWRILQTTVNSFRTWSKELTGILGLPEGTKGPGITAEIQKKIGELNYAKEDLNKAREDIKGLEAAKAAETTKLDKAIEDGRIKEEEHNKAMREELNKREQIEKRLRDKEAECAQHISDMQAKHKTELDKANEPKLTCAQFRKLAGHYTYDLLDPNFVENVEKMSMVLAVTIKYMLLFNVDQRFSQEHQFQAVFKDLYDISENDLVEGFLDVFASNDWFNKTINKWKQTEWNQEEPVAEIHPRAEAERIQMLLHYVDKGNDGRLYRGTDKDILQAAKIVLDDLSEEIIEGSEPYEALRAKAMANLNTANLNHLREVLDDLSLNLEKVTMEYLIDVNTFDTGGRSEKCKGVLNTMHCDEVNFIRLCYSYLRFYDRIWTTVDETDIPYGVLMAEITEASERCEGVLNFEIVNKVSKSTIYPAIGLYAFNPKWPSWSIQGKTIRHGPIERWLQIYESIRSSKPYDKIKPVIPLRAGIRVWKEGYNKTVGDTQHANLDWCYLGHTTKEGKKLIKDFYLSLQGNVLLEPYYQARELFFKRAIKHIDKIYAVDGYQPQSISVLTSVLKVVDDKKLKGPDVVNETVYLAERINIDEVFGYETWKYALLQLLSMHLFRVRFRDFGRVNTDNLRIIKIERIGYVTGRDQPFIGWDETKFVKYVIEQLNKVSNYYISPDFNEGKDLFRWIHRNLKVWSDPTRGSKLEKLIKDLGGL